MQDQNDYSELVMLCPMQKPGLRYKFTEQDEKYVCQMIYNNYIHHRFADEGLRYTLIHKLYQCTDKEVQFYVPELVYIAIRKNCHPMKKLLIYKASHSETLRRLILWNVKAFTVLIKQKDPSINAIIQQLEQNIVSSVKNRNKFNHSEKAICMLTTASLILKKMPVENLKAKLQKFIRRFNNEYLNNIQHSIYIPFNKSQQSLHSNYLVRIVEEDMSCFPTRKRVPYRIIVETIDCQQLLDKKPIDNFFQQQKIQSDNERDLYDQVTKIVNEMFSHTQFKSHASFDITSPFVVDKEQDKKITELTKYLKRVVKQQQQIEKQSTLKSKIKRSFVKKKESFLSNNSNTFKAFEKNKYNVQDNNNLKKFQSIYIPTLPSNLRKSESSSNLQDSHLKSKSMRWSEGVNEVEDVKIIQEEIKWNTLTQQSVWGLPWNVKEKKYRSASMFKKFNSLVLNNVVFKGGDDLRQEIICMQLIYKMDQIIKRQHIDIFIKPYQIIVLSENSGILQFVSNSISIDAMKKQKNMNISQFYHQTFETTQKLLKAKQNFIRSLAGSSILTYILKLKDRHNGNILLDNEGHIIHIDFGFILGMSPGGLNFEASPFKLTSQYMELIGGKQSPDYQFFKNLFIDGMQVLRKNVDEICLILQIMMEDSDLECFQNFNMTKFRDRFKPAMSLNKYKEHCENLIDKSCMNSRTAHYDSFQSYTNGIMP